MKEDAKVERMLISGVAADTNVARISVVGIQDVPGMAFTLFNLLSQKNINVDIILQSVGREGTKDITFTVSRDSLEDALAILRENAGQLKYQDLQYADNVAKVSIVGAGMISNPGVATKMFEALYNAHINIRMISTSEIKISVLIDERDVQVAMESIHDQFKLYQISQQ